MTVLKANFYGLGFWAFLCLCITGLFAAESVKSGFITTSDGVRLHYLEAGKGSAIVFVPGWTMPAEIWEAQIDYFARDHRVIAFDPRSQGDSEKPTEGHYVERRAQDVKELVDQLKLAPAVLVGWSMGVPELLAYVEQFGTSSIRALVLVDGSVGGDPDPEQIARRWASLKRMQENRKQATEQFVRGMYKKPHPESYYERITRAALKTPTNTAVVLSANMLAAQKDWRPVLSRCDRPVFFVAQSGIRRAAETVKQTLPSARIEIFEEAGHALFVDEAPRFNKLLGEFLSSSKPK